MINFTVVNKIPGSIFTADVFKAFDSLKFMVRVGPNIALNELLYNGEKRLMQCLYVE